MKFYILASLIIFSLTIYHAIRRSNNLLQKSKESFWEREEKSNNVRKVSLDSLPYIVFPQSLLSLIHKEANQCAQTSPGGEISDCIQILQTLTDAKIVNLTGYSNTDLKLKYGTANITALSEYDANYTLLVNTCQRLADELLSVGRISDAILIMEFAVSTGSDISRTYYELARYYSENGQIDKIEALKENAKKLNSLNSAVIVRRLTEAYQ